ncbi:hypothetical protein QQ008_14900 [Fulvivirgaceae bacterium BMA10]|uniref:Uncharacterized protein n=1 Tax=Splendidivirga corallicola TaxID=3051826 RepID=A0ABT8KPK6_9BACT|nr:hypothetical protein [Fulvivirgaceae bacterium BMA10]
MDYTSNNLNTFRILFLVKGILNLLFSLLPLGYASLGVFLRDEFSNNASGPVFITPGIIFLIFGSLWFVLTIAMGVLNLLASKYLNEVRNYTFIFVMAVLNCLTGVLGILLGVFTLVELNKPHVKELFGKN